MLCLASLWVLVVSFPAPGASAQSLQLELGDGQRDFDFDEATYRVDGKALFAQILILREVHRGQGCLVLLVLLFFFFSFF